MTSQRVIRAMVVDDDPGDRRRITETLRQLSWGLIDVVVTHDGPMIDAELEAAVRDARADLLVVDVVYDGEARQGPAGAMAFAFAERGVLVVLKSNHTLREDMQAELEAKISRGAGANIGLATTEGDLTWDERLPRLIENWCRTGGFGERLRAGIPYRTVTPDGPGWQLLGQASGALPALAPEATPGDEALLRLYGEMVRRTIPHALDERGHPTYVECLPSTAASLDTLPIETALLADSGGGTPIRALVRLGDRRGGTAEGADGGAARRDPAPWRLILGTMGSVDCRPEQHCLESLLASRLRPRATPTVIDRIELPGGRPAEPVHDAILHIVADADAVNRSARHLQDGVASLGLAMITLSLHGRTALTAAVHRLARTLVELGVQTVVVTHALDPHGASRWCQRFYPMLFMTGDAGLAMAHVSALSADRVDLLAPARTRVYSARDSCVRRSIGARPTATCHAPVGPDDRSEAPSRGLLSAESVDALIMVLSTCRLLDDPTRVLLLADLPRTLTDDLRRSDRPVTQARLDIAHLAALPRLDDGRLPLLVYVRALRRMVARTHRDEARDLEEMEAMIEREAKWRP